MKHKRYLIILQHTHTHLKALGISQQQQHYSLSVHLSFASLISNTMAPSRFIVNPYTDYQGENYLHPQNENRLNSQIEEFFVNKFYDLFQQLEENGIQYFLLHDPPGEVNWDVYTGIVGFSIFYLKLRDSGLVNERVVECLAKSRRLVQLASDCICAKNPPVSSSGVSFLCGQVGALAMKAVLTQGVFPTEHNSMPIELQHIFSIVEQVCNDSSISDELLYGRSGYLYALLFLRQKLPTRYLRELITDQLIRAVVEAILNSGMRTAEQERAPIPLAYYWYNEAYVGAAHGYVGILYMLLEAKQWLTDEELCGKVKPTLDYLCGLHYPQTANFPAVIGERRDELVHWCHGSPGVIHLLVLAYQIFNDIRYLQLANIAADDIWTRGLLQKGYGLCHGSSGNGYAFLRLYQLTREQRYLHRAIKFAEWATNYGKHGCRIPDTPYSLFEGMAGTLYYLLDLLNPLTAKFPGFQLS